MLPKNRRIPRKMFSLLSERPKMFKNNVFLLKMVSTKSNSRFCFSVSKKVAKSAVLRNKLRRTGYRFISNNLSGIKSNILALFSFKTVPKNDLEVYKSLESILKESKII